MKADDLRTKFVDFFVGKDHKLLPPASLIPENDPSVLFTSAGMQQFKRYYTEPDQAPAKNIVTVQPCFRTSDIEAVGDDTHLTFFEMLGNFSFGGYLKKEAVEMAYEFLTDVLNIDRARIKCSIFRGDEINPRDEKSAEILEKMGLKYDECGRDDNFWGPTGDEGPCGPTVEFYVNDIEVWNLVFNEYFKKADGSYRKIDTPGVDTGMGLERTLVVVDGLKDVYETDIFVPIIKKIEEISGKKYEENLLAFRIIIDHLRGACFILAEGVQPSNLASGYALRRLIRRTIRYGQRIGIENIFKTSLVEQFIRELPQSYSSLKEQEEFILNELDNEAQKFMKAIAEGIKKSHEIFDKKTPIDTEKYNKIMQIQDKKELLRKFYRNEIENIFDLESELSEKEIHEATISGKEAFDLYQSYGFPIEMILELAQEKKLFVDIEAYRRELKSHQEKSRSASAGMFKGGLAGESKVTTRMHTATHLLLKALQEVLGKDVHQRGSNISEERIRFDFSYPEAMTEEQIKKVEEIVNQKIKEDIPVVRKETTIEKAKKLGAEAQFLSKYGVYDKLTMYSIGNYSHELCGGPHVKTTSEIGKFKIVKEESSSAGVRRIRAVLE